MQRRKDNKGRVLKDGEVYRKSDGLYMYRWTAKNGKRHTIYDATLEGLREKEEKIQHDLAEGIRIPECSLTLNDLFELWRKNKVGLKEHTFANYNSCKVITNKPKKYAPGCPARSARHKSPKSDMRSKSSPLPYQSCSGFPGLSLPQGPL